MDNIIVRGFLRFCKTGAALLLITTACTAPFFNRENSEEIQADCFINLYLSAWIDMDEDGIWDNSELPLEGVEFQIDGQFASMYSDYPCVSNGDGKCIISTWTPGECEPREYKIAAVTPEPYRPTTPVSITLSLTSIDFSKEVQFGFTPY